MKKLYLFLLFTLGVASQLLADVTPTAAAVLAVAGETVTTTHTALMAALGACFALPLQSFIEHAIAEKPWMNAYAKSFKPLLPTLVTGLASWVALRFGFNPADVLTVFASAVAGAHLVNGSWLAADAKAE